MKELYRQRVLSNRKSVSLLKASIQELPWWYLKILQFKGLRPDEAVSHLIGFSNTTEFEESYKKENAIRKKLGLPYDNI